MNKYLKYLPIILIIGLALFLRVYRAEALFYYAHDNDLASWVVKDILVNHHLRLIGQQTSVLGVFIGGLFYYLQIPFYLLGHMDPIYTTLLPAILGTFSTFSFYFVFSKIFGKKVGIIAALIYAVSSIIVFSDRQVFPTTPVMLWTAWFFYDLCVIYKGRQKTGFILFAVLFSLIWHINIALLIITPLALLSFIASKKRINWKYLILGLGITAVLSSPLIVFELRHGFQQTRAVFSSLTTQRNLLPETGTGWAKLDRVMQLVEKNTTNIFFPSISIVSNKVALVMLIGIFGFLIYIKKISRNVAITFFLWQVLYIGFFSINSLNVSEYYLDGMNIIWIGIISIFMGYLLEKKKLKLAVTLLLSWYCFWNFHLITSAPDSTNGYVYKKAIVEYIKTDSVEHNFPCVSVSYITDPGYDLGYRYLFYLSDLHVNQPKSGSPVYTIVFPLKLVNRFDMRFGDLGLILPEYDKYSADEVDKSCQGENANLTDPMFGFTE